jgi:enoyl-CoA hydratase
MGYETILVEKKDRIAWVTLNNPQKLNVLTQRTIRELTDAMEQFRTDSGVGVVVITGAGDKAFAAGADIRELAEQDAAAGMEGSLAGQRLGRAIEHLGKPVIAMINGFALGGGCELAMACSIRIASDRARLGQPEVKIGIIPGFGGTQRLPRLVGKGRALLLILTGEQIDAQEALRIGLVDRVVPHERLRMETEAMARQILANAPLAVQYALSAVQNGLSMPLEEALQYESALFGLACATEDKNEGMRAFMEKRAPKWSSR